MSFKIGNDANRQACSRCRTQKRKCDKALPKCSLCMRLHRACIYEPTPISPSPSATCSSISQHHGVLGEAFTTSGIKAAVIQNLSENTPEEIASEFYCSIQTWFPVISPANLCRRLPETWENVSVDLCFVFLRMVLLNTLPDSSREPGTLSPDLKLLYLQCKCLMAELEGQGHNSLDLIQARLFITMFEIGHGIYPAAYISIGSLVRAMDAHALFSEPNSALGHSATEQEYQEECKQTWLGILIADRYVALENGNCFSIANGRGFPELTQSDSSFPVEENSPTPHAFSRLFEALNFQEAASRFFVKPHLEDVTNEDKIQAIMATLSAFSRRLEKESMHDLKLYNSSWAISRCLFLLLHGISRSYRHLESLLEEIAALVRPFVNGDTAIGFEILPPFITHPIYKASAIMTDRIRMGDNSRNSLEKLKSLRGMLKLIGSRWLGAYRYLKLLDEDTTPRMAKALE